MALRHPAEVVASAAVSPTTRARSEAPADPIRPPRTVTEKAPVEGRFIRREEVRAAASTLKARVMLAADWEGPAAVTARTMPTKPPPCTGPLKELELLRAR